MPRSTASALKNHSAQLAKIESTPIAFVVREMAGNSTRGLSHAPAGETLGKGSTGRLVAINGAQRSGSGILTQLRSSLVPFGAEASSDAIFVTLMDHSAAGAGAIPDHSFWQSTLVASGTFLVMFAFMLVFGLYPLWNLRAANPRPEAVEAVGSFPSVHFFEPILSQEELAADQEAEKKRSRIISRVA